jgi:spore maturation protein SpmA
MAKALSPVFVKVFPSIPKSPFDFLYDAEFCCYFLGLDSATNPFGLKAMESLQEINPEKRKLVMPNYVHVFARIRAY